MSETVIFSIGTVVFAITVYGTVMAGGHWMGRLAAQENPTVDLANPRASKSQPPTPQG